MHEYIELAIDLDKLYNSNNSLGKVIHPKRYPPQARSFDTEFPLIVKWGIIFEIE